MSDDGAPDDFTAGDWVIKVSQREASTLTVSLSTDGSVEGTMKYDELSGPLTGSWNYAAPVLTLQLESQLGLSPQPLDFEIVLSGGSPLKGTDTDGHAFTLTKGS